MNKMPLPLHLLTSIPGFKMMGQTSFGGYFKIIVTWWENDCPDIFEHASEFQSLSGMYERDYAKYRIKIEPVLFKSLEILKKYREMRIANTANKRAGMLRARAVYNNNLKLRKEQAKSKASMVDKDIPVNISPAIPSPKPFHEGWNLNKPNKAPKPTTTHATLVDK